MAKQWNPGLVDKVFISTSSPGIGKFRDGAFLLSSLSCLSWKAVTTISRELLNLFKVFVSGIEVIPLEDREILVYLSLRLYIWALSQSPVILIKYSKISSSVVETGESFEGIIHRAQITTTNPWWFKGYEVYSLLLISPEKMLWSQSLRLKSWIITHPPLLSKGNIEPSRNFEITPTFVSHLTEEEV